jgi:hypothetical protein
MAALAPATVADSAANRVQKICRSCRAALTGGFLTIVPGEPFVSESYRHLHGADRNRASRSSIGLSKSRSNILWTSQFELVEEPFGLIGLSCGPPASLVGDAMFNHVMIVSQSVRSNVRTGGCV